MKLRRTVYQQSALTRTSGPPVVCISTSAVPMVNKVNICKLKQLIPSSPKTVSMSSPPVTWRENRPERAVAPPQGGVADTYLSVTPVHVTALTTDTPPTSLFCPRRVVGGAQHRHQDAGRRSDVQVRPQTSDCMQYLYNIL